MNEQDNNPDLVSVFQAPDEVTAHLVRTVLEGAGVETVVVSRQVPWMDGIMTNAEGYWGDVMAPWSRSEDSIRIIEEFQSAALNEETDDSGTAPATETD